MQFGNYQQAMKLRDDAAKVTTPAAQITETALRDKLIASGQQKPGGVDTARIARILGGEVIIDGVRYKVSK